MSEKNSTEPNLSETIPCRKDASNRLSNGNHGRQGCFITLEGGEGAGKSTQLAVVEAWLQAQSLPYWLTREPGGPKVSEALRDILLDADQHVVPDAELLMMFAARAQQIQEWIRPKLARGIWVISDRFTDSTYAYQGHGRGFDLARIAYLEAWIQGDLQPDLTLFYDLPVAQGLARASKRGERDRIEQEPMAFFERVRQGYLDRAKQYAQRFRVVDASKPLTTVTEATQAMLVAFMQERDLDA